jgi:soluble lytic murein transglycosylase-like protein
MQTVVAQVAHYVNIYESVSPGDQEEREKEAQAHARQAKSRTTDASASGSGSRHSSTAANSDSHPIVTLVRRHAGRHGLSVSLVLAVIAVESGFNAGAVSPAGARGLMQLMPGTAACLGVSDPFDPDENIAGGTEYLGQQFRRFDGDLRLALAAYNTGPENVARHDGIPPFAETRAYVARVLQCRGSYRGND